MKNTKALSHIRQICSLGVDSHTVMPALIQALHQLIPSSNNLFIWTDREGHPVTRYCELYLPEVVEAMAQSLSGRTDIKALANSGRAVGNLRQRTPEFFRSPHFEEVYRPMRVRYSLDAVVRTAHGLEGVLILHRESMPFTEEEERTLEGVLPYLRHIWTGERQSSEDVFSDSDSHGTLLCDPQGRIQHISHSAFQLLAMSQGHGVTGVPPRPLRLPDHLQALIDSLVTASSPSEFSQASTIRIDNRWGRFIFRASWISGTVSKADRLVAISVLRQEPLSVRVVRGFQDSPLSPKQRAVALMLVTGHSAEEVVKELSISVTTYKDHLRKIYEKLGITRRVDLVRCLTQPTIAA